MGLGIIKLVLVVGWACVVVGQRQPNYNYLPPDNQPDLGFDQTGISGTKVGRPTPAPIVTTKRPRPTPTRRPRPTTPRPQPTTKRPTPVPAPTPAQDPHHHSHEHHVHGDHHHHHSSDPLDWLRESVPGEPGVDYPIY